MSNQIEQDINQLNSFLTGELSAVETYRQCIDKVDGPTFVTQLRQLKSSHEQRAHLLSAKISALGGKPASDSGVWGAFAKLLEGGAKIFGESAAVSVLEQGEDHGKADYERDMDKLSTEQRAFIELQVLPEQRRTHDALSALQNRM